MESENLSSSIDIVHFSPSRLAFSADMIPYFLILTLSIWRCFCSFDDIRDGQGSKNGKSDEWTDESTGKS